MPDIDKRYGPRRLTSVRKFVSLLAAFVTVAALSIVGLAPAASALSPGVEFSAADLPTWEPNGRIWALASAHGKVVAGGTFTQLVPPAGASGSPRAVNAIAVLDADTGAPSACQFTMTMPGRDPSVLALTAAPDGNSIYVGGNFASINGTTVLRLAEIDPVACTVKPLRVSTISSVVRAIAVSPDGGTVYFGGDFLSVASQARGRFAAVDAGSGDLLPWAPDAAGTDPGAPFNGNLDGQFVQGRGIAVSPDGAKVAVGGHFYTVNDADSHGLAVVDDDTGALLRAYPDGFIPHTSVIHPVVSDGEAFYAGAQGTGGGVFDGNFKIDWNTLDQVWRDTCLGATQVILPHHGTLYKAHHHHDCGSMNEFPDGKRIYLSAHSEEDSKLLGWFPTLNDGFGEGIGPRAMAIGTGSNGKDYLWVGGEFTRVNGKAQQALTRFGPDDTTVPPIPIPQAQAMSDGSIQVRFRTVVDPDDSDLTYALYRDGATTPIWTGSASSMWWVRPQVTVVDTDVTPGETYGYRVIASDGTNTSAKSALTAAAAVAARSDYASRVSADGADLYWRYDETAGKWLHDKSGATTSGLNGLYEQGAIGGAPGAIPDDPSTAATFNGSTQYAWSDQLKPAPATYSIETWFKTSTDRGGWIVGYGNGRPNTGTNATNLSSNHDRKLYMENSGRLDFGVWTGSAQIIRTAESYNDDQWHHVVATQGPSGMVLYVDGVRTGTNPTTTAQDYWGTWRVGGDNVRSWPNGPSSNFFAGSIDETAIYPTALTVRQVADHYTLGGGTPDVNEPPSDAYGAAVYDADPTLYWRLEETSGSSAADASFSGQNPGVSGWFTDVGQPGLIGYGVTVQGSALSTVGQSPSVASLTAFTAEVWLRTTSSSGGKVIGFENTRSGDGSSYDKHVYMTDEGSLVFGTYNGQADTLESDAGYNDGEWHLVNAVQDADGMRLYVDGALIASNSVVTNQAYSGHWRVGGGNLNGWPSRPSSDYFSGDLDEAAVYPVALTSSVVATHYALGVDDTQPPTAPTNVSAVAEDGAVQLTWDASTDNIAVLGYEVHRGADTDFIVNSSTKVADVTDTSWQDDEPVVGTGYYRIVAIDGAGNVSPASESVSISVEDVTAPSVPAGLVAQVDGDSVQVDWDASVDNVGVSGYDVYRGESADFGVDASSKVAEVTETSYGDAGLAVGTYFYKVVAFDAAGNRSAASDPVEAGVEPPPGPEPTTLTVVPTGDAMVYGSNPGSNYGSNIQLSSRGGSSPVQTFMGFDVPEAPDGTYLSGAVLTVRTSTDPTAGSGDDHRFNLVSGAWDEGTVTWSNRPTELGALVGVLSGATATNTSYDVTMGAGPLGQSLGSSVSLVMTSEGSDNLRLWSSEASNSAYRPILTLTFNAE